jgi:cyclopropane-fatty-acyl-phospholipid synthase
MPESWADRFLLRAIQKVADPVPVRVKLGPWSRESSQNLPALPVIRLKDRRALLSLLWNPGMNFGELYGTGELEVEGDLVELLVQLYRIPQGAMAKAASRFSGWMQSNSRSGSRKNVHHHYDISNDFYQLWLDAQMVYTCAYFPDDNVTLEEAQKAKLDLVCRKLWLRPGETVVDAGCGWGALALHMARYYGVRVKAFNISHEQIAFARERAQREGLASRVEFIEDDYRNITGKFDAFASVGMLEHVGRDHYREFGRVIQRVIGAEGRGLLHFIGRNRPAPLSAWIRKRIFPGGYTPVIREVMDLLEPHDFAVLDIENLRLHYARTIEHWLDRFERSYDKIAERFGTTFARMWRLYLAGSIAAFRVGTMQLFQIVFAGSACQGVPRTREHLYQKAGQQSGQDVEWIPAMS